MAGLSPEDALGAARSYVKQSLDGVGALKGAPCTIKSIEEIEGGNKVTFEWIDNSGNSHTSEMIVKDGESGGGTGGDSSLTKAITSNVEVGGVASGTTFAKGTSLESIINSILVKYNKPGATFSISPSTTLKLYGEKIASETLTVVATRTSMNITEIVFRVGSVSVQTITESVAGGGTFTYKYEPEDGITNSVTFYVDVKDGKDTTTKSITVTFCYPTYYGIVDSDVITMDSLDIQALSNKQAINSKGKTWSGITMTYGKLCYAYPKSFGALTSIKDANNVDYINSYARTEVTLTENGTSVVYYCYLLKDAAGVSNFKQVYA